MAKYRNRGDWLGANILPVMGIVIACALWAAWLYGGCEVCTVSDGVCEYAQVNDC